MIKCLKCPIYSYCLPLTEHKKEYRINYTETSWSEPSDIMHDYEGELVENNHLKCPLYQLMVEQVSFKRK